MNDLIAKLTAELWAMEPTRLAVFIEMLARLNARSDEARKVYFDEQDLSAPEDAPVLDVRDGVAHIPVCGPILKEENWFLDYFGIAYTSTLRTAAVVEQAIADASVKAIILDVDSPGGTVEGVDELAIVVREARGKKPISAHISGIGASAAYWIAAQADDISATHTTLVGSIGVYTVMADWSRFYESQGVKVHVISSHELKGAGVPGSKITEAQIADAQRLIDQFTDLFVGAIAEGRGMPDEKVRESATGQVWLAPDAKERGLIDDIGTAQEAHAAAAGSQFSPSAEGAHSQEGHMADIKNPAAVPQGDATSAEIAALKDKLAAAEAETARLKATDEAKTAALAAMADASKKELLEAAVADGRVPAASRPAFEKLATVETVDGFKATLAGLPVLTRKAQIGVSGGAATEGSALGTDGLSQDERDVCAVLGISAAALKRLGTAQSISIDGKNVVGADGKSFARKEVS